MNEKVQALNRRRSMVRYTVLGIAAMELIAVVLIIIGWQTAGIILGVAMIFYQGSLLVALVAIYLIVFPLVRVLLAERRGEQLKREAFRMILGVVLLVFVPNWTDAISNVLRILLFACGGMVVLLSLVFGIVEIIRIAKAKDVRISDADHVVVDFTVNED